MLGKDNGVSRIDLADVMDQKHSDDAIDIDGLACGLHQREREQSDLPAMLGRVFIAVEAAGTNLPRYRFQLVQFQDKVDNLLNFHSSL